MEPIIRGGQGREDHEVEADGSICGFIVCCIVAFMFAMFAAGCVSNLHNQLRGM